MALIYTVEGILIINLGDFTILMMQVARYLLKTYNMIQQGSNKPLGPNVSYLSHLNDVVFMLDSDSFEELSKP